MLAAVLQRNHEEKISAAQQRTAAWVHDELTVKYLSLLLIACILKSVLNHLTDVLKLQHLVASPAVAVAADWIPLPPIQPPTTTVGFSDSGAICAWSRLSELAT